MPNGKSPACSGDAKKLAAVAAINVRSGHRRDLNSRTINRSVGLQTLLMMIMMMMFS
jgi:hypothetical protein